MTNVITALYKVGLCSIFERSLHTALMAKYKKMIATTDADVNTLQANFKEAYLHRGKSAEHDAQRERALQAFYDYHSPMYQLIDECLQARCLSDPEHRAFVFDYIDHDPYFFRSGYILGDLLQLVKKLSLTDMEKLSLQRLILRRIDTRALRNFRRICRLIPKIQNAGFHAQVCKRAKSDDPQVRRRAAFALDYFRDEYRD